MEQFVCYKGIWKSANEFIIDEGSSIKIAAFGQDLDYYRERFPIHCYVLMQGVFLKQLVEIEDNVENLVV